MFRAVLPIALAGGVAAILLVAGPGLADLPTGVGDVPRWFSDAPEQALVTAVAAAAWACLLWLCLGVVIGSLAALPGAAGRGAGRLSRWMLPRALHRLLEVSLGLTIVASSAGGLIAATPASASVPRDSPTAAQTHAFPDVSAPVVPAPAQSGAPGSFPDLSAPVVNPRSPDLSAPVVSSGPGTSSPTRGGPAPAPAPPPAASRAPAAPTRNPPAPATRPPTTQPPAPAPAPATTAPAAPPPAPAPAPATTTPATPPPAVPAPATTPPAAPVTPPVLAPVTATPAPSAPTTGPAIPLTPSAPDASGQPSGSPTAPASASPGGPQPGLPAGTPIVVLTPRDQGVPPSATPQTGAPAPGAPSSSPSPTAASPSPTALPAPPSQPVDPTWTPAATPTPSMSPTPWTPTMPTTAPPPSTVRPAGMPAGGFPDLTAPTIPSPSPGLDPLGGSAPRGIGEPPGSGSSAEVVVHRGDSLWTIAARHLGPSATDAQIAAEWPRWWAANQDAIGPDPGLILPGQRLRPPDGP
ncbi:MULTISPECIES: LysM peptidoglycan-binding domain-containing protein [Pseudofrankia]|uniref:LysM peptidoglycan-binding domain-containing protein n=1 Tax=Pseudofrankia TaxID=2994363 RepID=UPI0006872832|nr:MULTISPECIES: LysM domain-containing protein [Pseudofrankia]